MKKVILIYGLIAGAIVAGMMFITMPMYVSGTLNFDNGEWLGYTTMAVALSMIFFGVKSYRDNYAGGEISFWKAVKMGLLITGVACVMYALAWEVSYQRIGDEFMREMIAHEYAEWEKEGYTQEEIAEGKASMEAFGEMYKNPIVRFLFTMLVEMFPVGLAITLVSAGLLRMKNFLPARAAKAVAS